MHGSRSKHYWHKSRRIGPPPMERPFPARAAFLCVGCGRSIQAGQPMRSGPLHAYCTARKVES